MIGELHTLGVPCQARPNAGYLATLLLVATSSLAYQLDADTLNTLPNHGLLLWPGAKIYEIRLRPQSATLTESQAPGPDGTAYVSEVAIPLPGEVPALPGWVKQNENTRWVAVLRDTLGNHYVMGTKEQGARLTWSRQVTARHGHSLLLRATTLNPVAAIGTSDPAALFPSTEFDASFDLSFS